jgi:dTDP-glucose 4,6-dehydratase
LITGGAGFIGSNFVRYWTSKYPRDRLVVLDALTYAGNLHNLADVMGRPSFRFVRGDICDTALVESLLRDEHLDTIVHFAAESHVDRSIEAPDTFVQTNVVGTHSLLRAARTIWLSERRAAPHRFHHVSTDEVYGSLGPNDVPFSETAPYAPNSPYSASKAASDHLVRAYHRTYGLDVTISNCSNNYGPFHFPEKLIPLMIVNALQGKPLPVYGDGKHVRDWLHVSDHCRGIELVIERGEAGHAYNIGGGEEAENIALVESLCAVLDAAHGNGLVSRERFPQAAPVAGKSASSLITYVTDRPGHDRRYAIDSSKIERALGYRASIGLREGLEETVRWYLTNEVWWRGVLDGSYRAASVSPCLSVA